MNTSTLDLESEQELRYGSNTPGRPFEHDRTWRREDIYTGRETGKKTRELRFCAGADDLTPPHSSYPTGYAAACSCCWLGFSHTEAYHAQMAGKAVQS